MQDVRVNPVEMARCVDCYAVMFADEMKRCAAGHWTCPECSCDCSANQRPHTPAWIQSGLEMQAEAQSRIS